MPPTPIIKVIRAGDVTKAHPFTICIVANPALETPEGSGVFVVDPVTSHELEFDAGANFVVQSLFGALPNQAERFLGDPTIEPMVRVVSLFVSGLNAEDANALVAEDHDPNLLVPRRTAFAPFLARFGLAADVACAISRSRRHLQARAIPTTDDDTRGGVSFTLDGTRMWHRYWSVIPGTIALHTTSRSVEALHEFGHALSSFTNGQVVDLYADVPPALNNKVGLPIPPTFAVYNGTSLASDPTRDGLGYGNWKSYHCELINPAFPAMMDDYHSAHDRVPEHCQHDRITRMFLLDRVRAKLGR